MLVSSNSNGRNGVIVDSIGISLIKSGERRFVRAQGYIRYGAVNRQYGGLTFP